MLTLSSSTLLSLDVHNLVSHYRTWGPSARTCIDLERGSLESAQIEADVQESAHQFVSEARSMLMSLGALNPKNQYSHALFALRPRQLEVKGRSVSRALIPTHHLLSFVGTAAAAALDAAQQCHLFSFLCEHPWLRGSGGYFYKKFVHARLSVNRSCELLVIVPADRGSPDLTLPALATFNQLNGLPRLKKANEHRLPFYWRPTSNSFSSVDAIICTAREIILLQSVVSPAHNIKIEGLENILKVLPVGFRSARRLCLVFVTDTEETATSLRARDLASLSNFKNLHIYSCVLAFHSGPSETTVSGILCMHT